MYNINDLRVISNLFSMYLSENKIESNIMKNIFLSNNNSNIKNNYKHTNNISEKIPLDEKLINEIYYPIGYSEINESDIKKKMVLFNINTWDVKYYIYKEIPWDYEGKELKKEDVFGIYRGNGDLDIYLRIDTPF
ncbi:MAG: hypothetical protein QXL18_02970 [Candidatus Woesearchaeota archaeon]